MKQAYFWVRGRYRGVKSWLDQFDALSYYLLIICSTTLVLIGLYMDISIQQVQIASDSESSASLTQLYKPYLRTTLIYLVGIAAAWGVSRLKPAIIIRYGWLMLVPAAILQTLIFTSLGVTIGGNAGWVQLPGIGPVQPAELSKLALILALAAVLDRYTGAITSRVALALMGFIVAATAGLVVLGKDLGSALVMVVIVAAMLVIAKFPAKYMAITGALGAVGISILTYMSANRRARISAWWNMPSLADDESGLTYQPHHAEYAFAHGGVLGVGSDGSREKWGYLTQSESDYVYAVLGEEHGLVGTLAVLIIFLLIGYCCMRVMRAHVRNRYILFATTGICTWLVGQALINIMVATGLLPVLGVPLPLISKGGSSTVAIMLAVGVLTCFARNEPSAIAVLRSQSQANRRTVLEALSKWRIWHRG